MSKGYKSSELYVVIAVIAPWILSQLGIDLGAVITDADQLRAVIQEAHNGSDLPVWVAGLFVISRPFLKWKGLGSKKE